MNLGFIGTGEITKAVVIGILKSKIKYKKIYCFFLSKIPKKFWFLLIVLSFKNIEIKADITINGACPGCQSPKSKINTKEEIKFL